MKIIIAVITWFIIIHTPLWADIIILKDGKVFEGEIIKEDSGQIELKTEYGTLTLSKGDIKQIAKDVKELLKPFDELWQEAKACYGRARELKEDPVAKNKELLKGKNLLYEAHQGYDEIRQMFPQDEYVWIDRKKKEILELMKEFRCARVKVSEEELRKTAYQEKLSELKDDDAEGHYQLALWCEKEGLKEQMLEELAKVIKTDPEHIQARERLNYIKKEDRWVHKDELPVEKPASPVEEIVAMPPPPPPKPLTCDELIALLKSGTVEEKLKTIRKLARSPEDKAIQPLINEFVKTGQDPEVYESIKSVLPRFNPAKTASSIKRMLTSKKSDNISRRARQDARAILSRVDRKEYVKLLTQEFLDKAKFLARGRFKSDVEKMQSYKELGAIRSSIVRSPAKDEAIPLVSKSLRPSTKSAIRKAVIRLITDIGTEKAVETLANQLTAGTSGKDLQPMVDALIDINLPNVFMPLVKNLNKERLKSRTAELLLRLTAQTFGYDKEKWLDWWVRAKDNVEEIIREAEIQRRMREEGFGRGRWR